MLFDAGTLDNMGATTLLVEGNTGNAFELRGSGWSYTGPAGAYYTYSDASGNILEISQALKRVYTGTNGADSFEVNDTNSDGRISADDFASINGGLGLDSLVVGGQNLIFDLSHLGAGVISGIERIDLGTGGTNRLVLDQTSLTNMGIAVSQALTVDGNAGDTFDLKGTWTFLGTSGGYSRYKDAGNHEVLIENALKRVYDGTTGTNALVLDDVNGNGVVSWEDFSAVHGNGVTSTLGVAGNGTTLDLCGLPALDTVIHGVKIIDLGGNGNNTVILDADTHTGMGLLPADVLLINGEAGDSFDLRGSWTYSGMTAGRHIFVDAGFRTISIAPELVRAYTGDAGNNSFALADLSGDGTIDKADFARINGGGGSDTLTFDAGTAAGTTLDLTGLTAGTVQGIGTVDISGHGNNHVLIDAGTLVGQSNPLTLTGNAGDTYELVGAGWNYTGAASGFHTYSNGTHTLSVADDLTRVLHAPDAGVGIENTRITDILYGGTGADTFALNDLNGDGMVDKADFGRIAGGGGSDVLTFAAGTTAGTTLDLTGLAAGTIQGIDTVDVAGFGDNHVLIDAGTLAGQSNPLTLTGNAGDTYELMGAGWSYTGTALGFHTYSDGAHILRVADDLTRVLHAPDSGVGLENTLATDILHGGAGVDTFSMADLSADGKITGADFGELHGAGMDVLHVAGAGLTLDLTDLGAGKISGIEHIDLGAAGNTLSLDQGTFTDLNVTDLHITGGGADQVDLTGNWSWDDLAGGYTLGGRQVILDNPVGVVIHADATGEIFAGPGDVAVYCGTGDDTIHGNTGNDTIHAGTGTNTLYGGDGQDLFIWDTAAMNGSLDTIMDFALGEDRMGFVELFADSGVPDSSAVHDVPQQHRIEVEATDANNLTVTVGPQTVAVHLSGAGFVDYAAIYDTNPVVAEEAKAALLEQMLRGVTG